MEIRIAHLYYDLLNLYGEQGNIIALNKALTNQNIEVKVDLLSCNNRIDFDKYDIFYIGSGSEENLIIALNNIKKYREDIKKVIDKGKYFIATGNAYLLFGKFIEMNNQKYNGLGIFDYYAKQNPSRIVGESFMKYDNLTPIIGFQNRDCVVHNEVNHLFELINGYADNLKSEYEGYHDNNFYGTHLIGPLLIRNPQFTDMLVEEITENSKLKYHDEKDTPEYQAYQEYLVNFYHKENKKTE